ncbi:hypothetical protein HanIR_Chr10g0490711 [Helianthus annuus]|nr:hypothetical protein HanIR_Chr10g0490711 [Helianthus annuus]
MKLLLTFHYNFFFFFERHSSLQITAKFLHFSWISFTSRKHELHADCISSKYFFIFKISIGSTTVSCGNGDVKVSRVDVWKTVNSKLNSLQIRKLNCYDKHVTDIRRHERQITKFVVNAASD